MSANAPDPSVVAELRARAATPNGPRVESVDLAGRRYWIKRPEVLSLRWRLQKGDPARSFEREKDAHRTLITAGAPVPPIIDEGPGFIILADCGPTLATLLTAPEHPERGPAFAAAGTTLARLHALGLAHGRPQPRDLCWDGEQIVFLDFEGGARRGAGQNRQAWDLIQLVYGTYCLALYESPEVEAACVAYRAADTRGIWSAAERLARRLRWIDPLTRPFQRYEERHKPNKRFNETRSVPLTLARFGVS